MVRPVTVHKQKPKIDCSKSEVAEAKMRFCFAITKVGRIKEETEAVGTVEVPGAVVDAGILCWSW